MKLILPARDFIVFSSDPAALEQAELPKKLADAISAGGIVCAMLVWPQLD